MPWITKISDAFIFFFTIVNSQLHLANCISVKRIEKMLRLELLCWLVLKIFSCLNWRQWPFILSSPFHIGLDLGSEQFGLEGTIKEHLVQAPCHEQGPLSFTWSACSKYCPAWLWTLPVMWHPKNFCSTTFRDPFQFTLLSGSVSTQCTG